MHFAQNLLITLHVVRSKSCFIELLQGFVQFTETTNTNINLLFIIGTVKVLFFVGINFRAWFG